MSIRFKRGQKLNLPTGSEGEPLYTTDDREFYVGGAGRNRRVDFPAIYPEEYGAKGDGTTDDTVAIQAAADALSEGDALVFSAGKTYRTKTIYIHTNHVWVGCPCGQATLSLDTSTGYGLLVHGGTIAAADRTYAYFLSTFIVSDYNASRIHDVTVENLKITAHTTTKNTSIALVWADNSKIINCETEESDGNGYDIRNSRNPIIRGCRSTSPATYNLFCFMCSNAIIEDNVFYGGTAGVALKHRYNDEPCKHTVRNNRMSRIEGGYVTGGYNMSASNTDPYYLGSYEIVEDVIVEDNIFESTNAETYCPNIWICAYANNWTIRNNLFDGGGVASGANPIYIGTLGDWYSNGNTGIYGENHIIEGNVFIDMTITPVFDVGCSCTIKDNIINCSTLACIQDNSTYKLHSTLRVDASKNKLLAARLSASGESGFAVLSSNVANAVISENYINLTPADYSSCDYVSGIYTAAAHTVIDRNNIILNLGTANHLYSYGVVLVGNSSRVVNNNISVDATTTRVGIVLSSSAATDTHFICGNLLTNLGAQSGSTGILLGDVAVCYYNKFTGTWNSNVSDSVGGFGYGLGTRRIAYSTAAPTSGTWTTGDTVYKTNASIGDMVGWYCVSGGTPGTWSSICLVGYMNQSVLTTSGPTFDHLHITNGATFGDQPRTATSLYRRYYHLPLGSSNPGSSGATWVDAGANTTGGWQLDSATEKIRGGTDIHSDWDGASDLKVEVRFATNVDNSGGSDTDTVDLKLVAYYKGAGDTTTKSQTIEVSTVVGKAAQYKAFIANFTLDWDYASNVIEAGDHIACYLNLETDTSEVDNVIIAGMSLSYLTTHIGIEDGDEL